MKFQKIACPLLAALILAFAAPSFAEPVDGDGIVTIPDEELVFSEYPDLPTPIQAAEDGIFPNDPDYSKQWNTLMVRPEKIYSKRLYGKSVKIAVVDSGSPSKHPDIGGNIVAEADFTRNKVGLYDSYGHCTFISGIIGADTNNGIGIAGVLPSVSIYSLRGLEGRTGYISDIANAIKAAVDTYDCDVINLSLTTPSDFTELHSAINHALDSGAIVVAASGNKSGANKGTELLYPAAYDGVIGVGAIDKNKARGSFSHYNSSVDACAPGVDVYSTVISGGYGTGRGTSYAAPYVSAAAAVAKYFEPEIDSSGFMQLLEKTCEPLGGTTQGERNDEYGYGMVDFQNIVEYYEAAGIPPAYTPEPEPTAAPTETPAPYPTNEPTAAPGPEFPAAIENISIYKSADHIDLSFTVTNGSANAVSGDVYICAYGDDMTLAATEIIENVSLNGSDGKDFSRAFKVPSGAAELKIFYWTDNLTPLAAARTAE